MAAALLGLLRPSWVLLDSPKAAEVEPGTPYGTTHERWTYLQDMLRDVATADMDRGFLFYQLGSDATSVPTKVPYHALYIRIHAVESMLDKSTSSYDPLSGHKLPPLHRRPGLQGSGIAALMLTSGSTGNAKAVSLPHSQILASVSGKASFHTLPLGKSLLNWIGLDHVAGLIEIHLLAMFLGVDQIHVRVTGVVSTPTLFLEPISQHQKLVSAVANEATSAWDFRYLSWLGSGGEANDTEICVAPTELLAKYGAPRGVIVPGFGMNETSAGGIYNAECPDLETKHMRPWASLGKCMEGTEMRIQWVVKKTPIPRVIPTRPLLSTNHTLQQNGQITTKASLEAKRPPFHA
ncbi:acetyl-CoA synthetase-like protein [Thozetella sp. PMI_491]|nr:acetyl-CoA synthetase-like protein [Thozetella sp. PMI_491]